MNKRKILTLVSFLLSVILLTGCSLELPESITKPLSDAFEGMKIVYQEMMDTLGLSHDEESVTVEDITEYLNEDDTYSKEGEESEVLTEKDLDKYEFVDSESVKETQSESSEKYYYKLLDSNERKVYSEILYILTNMQSEVALSTTDIDMVDKVFEYVYNDHPELFYVDGYNYVKYLIEDEVKKLTFTGSYTMTEDKVSSYRTKIDEYTENFLNAYNESLLELSEDEVADDYYKCRFTYEYIIENTDYDKVAPDNQTIVSVMVNGKSVCSGYSKTAQYLLEKLGIENTFVRGRVIEGETHSWNLVKADGDYYYMDVTWGDATFTLKDASEEYEQSLPPVNYSYMLTTTEELKKTHIFDEEELFPEATSMKDDYFVREGLYFTELDKSQLKAAFKNAYAADEDLIMIKMSSEEVYDDIWDYLINKQRVFDYLKNSGGSVSYSENREQLYMIIWI